MLAVTLDGINSMPRRVPFAGRAAWTLDTVQTSERDVADTVATRAAVRVMRSVPRIVLSCTELSIKMFSVLGSEKKVMRDGGFALLYNYISTRYEDR